MFGGAGHNKLQVLEWSEETGFSWTVKAGPPAARRGGAIVAHEEKLWVVGGRETDATESGTSSVAVYDVSADAWGDPKIPSFFDKVVRF